MSEIIIDWSSLIPFLYVTRIVLVATSVYLLLDTIFMVGFMDGPKTALCFKLLSVWMAIASMGLLIFSLSGNAKMMFFFTIASLVGLSLSRLWTWAKGLYLSKFVIGEAIKIK